MKSHKIISFETLLICRKIITPKKPADRVCTMTHNHKFLMSKWVVFFYQRSAFKKTVNLVSFIWIWSLAYLSSFTLSQAKLKKKREDYSKIFSGIGQCYLIKIVIDIQDHFKWLKIDKKNKTLYFEFYKNKIENKWFF